MSEIIIIKQKQKARYAEVKKRIGELDIILGFSRNEHGESLSLRSRDDAFAEKMFNRIKEKYAAEYEEMMQLTAEAVILEDELGISAEYEKLLAQVDIPDETCDIW